jgi:hypothetical protein
LIKSAHEILFDALNRRASNTPLSEALIECSDRERVHAAERNIPQMLLHLLGEPGFADRNGLFIERLWPVILG